VRRIKIATGVLRFPGAVARGARGPPERCADGGDDAGLNVVMRLGSRDNFVDDSAARRHLRRRRLAHRHLWRTHNADISERAPSAAKLAATLPAPPKHSLCSTKSTMGTAASGDRREAVPRGSGRASHHRLRRLVCRAAAERGVSAGYEFGGSVVIGLSLAGAMLIPGRWWPRRLA